jgi:hypothetical protein
MLFQWLNGNDLSGWANCPGDRNRVRPDVGTDVDSSVARPQEGQEKRKVRSLMGTALVQLICDQIPCETFKRAPRGRDNFSLHRWASSPAVLLRRYRSRASLTARRGVTGRHDPLVPRWRRPRRNRQLHRRLTPPDRVRAAIRSSPRAVSGPPNAKISCADSPSRRSSHRARRDNPDGHQTVITTMRVSMARRGGRTCCAE